MRKNYISPQVSYSWQAFKYFILNSGTELITTKY